MNKKDFVILLRAVIRTELKPIVKEVVQHEFRLLRESLVQAKSKPLTQREMLLSEDISIENLMAEEDLLLKDVIVQEESQEVEIPKLFKGDNIFTNMLQKTIEEGYKVGSVQREVPAGRQNLVQIESPNRADMLSAIGYGNLKNGEAVSVPSENVVQVPQETPDGKPINPNAIPDFLLKAMNKDYSKDLKTLEIADKRRHGE